MIVILEPSQPENLDRLLNQGLRQILGQVPLLIISTSSVAIKTSHVIRYLTFPFDAQMLMDQVAQILEAGNKSKIRERGGVGYPPAP